MLFTGFKQYTFVWMQIISFAFLKKMYSSRKNKNQFIIVYHSNGMNPFIVRMKFTDIFIYKIIIAQVDVECNGRTRQFGARNVIFSSRFR